MVQTLSLINQLLSPASTCEARHPMTAVACCTRSAGDPGSIVFKRMSACCAISLKAAVKS